MKKILMQVGDPVGHAGVSYVAEKTKNPDRVCSFKCYKCATIFDARLALVRSGHVQNCGCAPKQTVSRARLAGQDNTPKQKRARVKSDDPTVNRLNKILMTLDRPRLSSSELVRVCLELVTICDKLDAKKSLNNLLDFPN